MPLIPKSSYVPPRIFSNRHLQTVYANAFRRVPGIQYREERIHTEDDDFLDLHWSEKGNRQLVIISHGMEGHAERPYVRGMAKAVNEAGFDALAWNFRGCGTEVNKQMIYYHGASTWDLEAVIGHVVENYQYKAIYLVGFSLGANLNFRYLGEKWKDVPEKLRSCVGISVPCSLETTAMQLDQPENIVYMKMFLNDMKNKMEAKADRFGEVLDLEAGRRSRNLLEFDEAVTSRVHGFGGATEFYQKTCCGPYLHQVSIPALIINAKDDPFLGPDSFPIQQARNNKNLFLEMPEYGGHVGFYDGNGFWAETRVVEWLRKYA